MRESESIVACKLHWRSCEKASEVSYFYNNMHFIVVKIIMILMILWNMFCWTRVIFQAWDYSYFGLSLILSVRFRDRIVLWFALLLVCLFSPIGLFKHACIRLTFWTSLMLTNWVFSKWIRQICQISQILLKYLFFIPSIYPKLNSKCS